MKRVTWFKEGCHEQNISNIWKMGCSKFVGVQQPDVSICFALSCGISILHGMKIMMVKNSAL